MKTILLKIDTIGDINDHPYFDFTPNQVMYDLVVSRMVFLVRDNSIVQMKDEIDILETRKYYDEGNNGHCIVQKEGGYYSALEYTHIAVKVEDDCFFHTLSEFCDYLSITYNAPNWITYN